MAFSAEIQSCLAPTLGPLFKNSLAVKLLISWWTSLAPWYHLNTDNYVAMQTTIKNIAYYNADADAADDTDNYADNRWRHYAEDGQQRRQLRRYTDNVRQQRCRLWRRRNDTDNFVDDGWLCRWRTTKKRTDKDAYDRWGCRQQNTMQMNYDVT